jgi:hypothetical protein
MRICEIPESVLLIIADCLECEEFGKLLVTNRFMNKVFACRTDLRRIHWVFTDRYQQWSREYHKLVR